MFKLDPAASRTNWREVDVDEMAADLLRSDLIVSPPDDLESMIDSCNMTLRYGQSGPRNVARHDGSTVSDMSPNG